MGGLGAKRIVVADNDPEWLELIVLDLELEGHEIVGRATTGEGALRECAELLPDVLVVDHRMPPGMTGLMVVERLRDTNPDVRAIVFSNFEDPALAEAVERAGARFVLKTNMRALRQAVVDA
jgi:CheY-like chemotaxis protein